MNKQFAYWLSTILMGTAFFLLVGCEDTVDNIGGELIPQDDRLSFAYTDSLDISLSSTLVDSINTGYASRHMVGNYIDPVFGRISTATALEFLPNTNLNFGDAANLIFDSLELLLEFDGSYGTPNQAQNLHIYLLDQVIDSNVVIPSNQSINFVAQDLGPVITLIDENASGLLNYSIRLDDALGEKILFADSLILQDENLFRSFFPGLYFTTDPVEFLVREPGAIFSLVPGGADTRLILHYKKREAGSQAFLTREEPFAVQSASRRYHTIDRTEVADKLLSQQLMEPDTQDLLEFTQEGALIYNWLQFPGIDGLKEITIHSASIAIKVDPTYLGSDNRYAPPNELFLYYANEAGEFSVTEDGVIQQFSTFAATYNSTKQQYELEVSRYIQEVINGQRQNNGLILIPANAGFRPNRAVLGGIGHPTLAPKLEMTYSTLPRR